MENVKIADFMLQHIGRDSMLTGKSVHNQRVERLWRDIYDGVLGFYSELFTFMEECAILDIMSPLHIYALHYVMGKINSKLKTWSKAWGTHRLHTVRSTPLKLWTSGMTNSTTSEPEGPVDDSTENHNNTGIGDGTGTQPSFESLEVEITDHFRQLLMRQCPKEWFSANYGIDVYQKAVELLQGNKVTTLTH